MLKKFINFWKSDGQESFHTPSDVNIVFELSYKDLILGYLSVDNGEWKFYYSEEFKGQDSLLPLVDFPNKNKTYYSHELWPFFMSRIPGMGQPKVQEILKKENIRENDEVSLLRLFGKRTIANPYTLEPAL